MTYMLNFNIFSQHINPSPDSVALLVVLLSCCDTCKELSECCQLLVDKFESITPQTCVLTCHMLAANIFKLLKLP